ncbi:hypothetical protein FHT39_002559 [Mitsuaria sp. BK045]|uniref:DUF1801 domain-containing protein n=1 Tax=unclassified Roseateles TaxID=2626991 RepID=UPI00161E5299|nr:MULTISPECIES: DUF1801 domain-containing protein [unclassified Roseateles]MBB3293920.1 hypothetical protein [Mitsuaria sp. BK041]MBB3363137.1 hypothetical protein [Mitsuaria sp. BK045]
MPTTTPSPTTEAAGAVDAAAMIDARIAELGDWRGEMLARLRRLMKEAVPGVEETWKWRGTPVWERNGQICTGETYKEVVKMTFAKGAKLADPTRLFNSSLDGNVRRAIDIRQGDPVDEQALKALFKAAAALNDTAAKPKKATRAA